MEFHRDALKSWMHFLFVHKVGEGLNEQLLNKTAELGRKKKAMSQADRQSQDNALV